VKVKHNNTCHCPLFVWLCEYAALFALAWEKDNKRFLHETRFETLDKEDAARAHQNPTKTKVYTEQSRGICVLSRLFVISRKSTCD